VSARGGRVDVLGAVIEQACFDHGFFFGRSDGRFFLGWSEHVAAGVMCWVPSSKRPILEDGVFFSRSDGRFFLGRCQHMAQVSQLLAGGGPR